MVSILKTDKIQASHGSTIEIPSGHVLNAPGHVIQVAMGTNNAETVFSSTSYAATDVFATITPKFSSSAMVIVTSINMDYEGTDRAMLAIHKDGTLLGDGTGTYDGHQYYNRVSNSRILTQQPVFVNDSLVGTTNAVTYKLYIKVSSGNVRMRNDLAQATITVMEIAQ